MSTLTAFFILMWYQASAPWWIAFSVILALKVGYFIVTEFEEEIKKTFKFEDQGESPFSQSTGELTDYLYNSCS